MINDADWRHREHPATQETPPDLHATRAANSAPARESQAAPDGTAGAAGGLLNAVRQTGATLGVAVMGAVSVNHALFLAAAVCAAAGGWFATRVAPQYQGS
jgi:hypothetical protein